MASRTVLFLLVIMVATAQADERWYAGGGVGSFKTKVTDPRLPLTFTSFGGYGSVGYRFNDYVGAEVRVGGTGSDTQPIPGSWFNSRFDGSMQAQTDHFFSGLVRVSTGEHRPVRGYALLGATRGKMVARFSLLGIGMDTDETDSDFTYGAGAEAKVGKRLSLGLEWVRYFDAGDTVVDGTCATARYRF